MSDTEPRDEAALSDDAARRAAAHADDAPAARDDAGRADEARPDKDAAARNNADQAGPARAGDELAAADEAAGLATPDDHAAARDDAPDDLAAAREAARRDFAAEQAQSRRGRRAAARDDAPDDLAAAREAARRDFAAEQAQSRRGRRAAARAAAQSAPPDSGMTRGYARGRARDEAVRAGLTPLGPDERPLGLMLAIGLVLLICGANTVLAAIDGHVPAAIAFGVGGVALAAGLWARIYLVVVIVEALLALAIIFAAIALLFAGTVAEAGFALAVILLSGPVFWLLVRVMARLQVPPQ